MIANRKSGKKSCPIVTESFRGQEFYLFSSDNPNLSSDNPLRFRKKLFEEMSTSKTIKATNNKIEQSKAQYNLDRKATKIFALSSANASNYEFLTDKYVLPTKDFFRKKLLESKTI